MDRKNIAKIVRQGPDQHHLLLISHGFAKMDLLRSIIEDLGSTLECLTPTAMEQQSAQKVPGMLLLGPDLSDQECAQICTFLGAHDQWQNCRCIMLTNPQYCSSGRSALIEQGLVHGVLGWPVAEILFKEFLSTHLRLLQTRDKLYSIKGLFHNEHTVMLIIDPGTGLIVDANPGAILFYGWSLSELRQMHIGEITTLPLEKIKEAFSKISNLEQHYFEGQHRLANGDIRQVEVWSGPVSKNENTWLYSMIFDVTERNRLQQKLTQAAAQAQAATQAKNEFLANMSHEIRTPLNGILGVLQVLQYTSLDQKQQKLVELATTAATRLTRLLSDILDLSRVGAGKMSLHQNKFDLGEVCQAIIDLLFTATSNTDLKLSFDLDPQVPTHLMGDEIRLMQILFNLVGNALKFTEQGRVDVSITKLPHTGPQVWLFFQIEDTGPGIHDQRLREIFQPFVQVETSYTRSHQGAGLGLAIVHRLVTLMKGTMSVDSTLGEGTTIGVSLPFALPPPALVPDAAPHVESSAPTRTLRILLVEDDEVNL